MKRRLGTLILLATSLASLTTTQAQDPLPSWNDGPNKQAIVDFVTKTTTAGSPDFVPPEERIATFDQDGTLWVEHPIYTQVMYCLERVPALVKAKPELAKVAPFNTVLDLLHGDAEREYAYGPATGLPDTKVGTFTQALYDEAKKDGWNVISMKHDWKTIFAFEMVK